MKRPFVRNENTSAFLKGIPCSYSQIFFSENPWFGWLLVAVTFLNPYAGISGLVAVAVSNSLALKLGYHKNLTAKGIYGFNSLLSALGLGVTFEHSWQLFLIIILAGFLNLFISISLQGVMSKYSLPFLSLPFLISTWIIVLSTRSFDSLSLNDSGIFTLNELYRLGGGNLVKLYEASISLKLPLSVQAYFASLGALFFQFNILGGIIIATGLLLFSRIAFTLSLIGFYSAWWFYRMLGIDMSLFLYNYAGFNYILTAIAIGGYFYVPSAASYLWTVILTPVVALIMVSFFNLFQTVQLPVYSLPFNLVVLLFLYSIKMRVYPLGKLSEVFIQRSSPEDNLYTHLISKNRFRFVFHLPVKLPFWGEWTVLQGHDGEYTHKDVYRHAWDYVITDKNGKQYKNDGDILSDYYCYEKAVVAPADGIVSDVTDGVSDNPVGKINLVNNWGNTVVIKHGEALYSNISHLKANSIKVKKGDQVKAGDILGVCGNSGRSPYPHLHFQLQTSPFTGAETLEYPISHYISSNGSVSFHHYESPLLNECVSNVRNTPLLQNAFDFTMHRTVATDIHFHDHIRKSRWEVLTDIYNQSYLWEKDTLSAAYFVNDGTLFRFTRFEGKKSSLLYIFYLAFYEVLLANYPQLKLEMPIPLNQVFRRYTLSLYDFIAPFSGFLKASYSIRYITGETVLSTDRIVLLSEIKTKALGPEKSKFRFLAEITEKGIEKIKIITNDSEKNELITNYNRIIPDNSIVG